MANNTSGGGAATHAGTNYQDRVAAWTAVQILAEQDVQPPWDLPATVTLETLHAEAPHPIDDLTVTTSAGGTVFAQAKHTVTLDTTATSPLGSTIAQFVKEFRAASQPFDPAKDRFVLTTSPQSSAPIRTHLPAFLARMRTSPDPDAEWTSGSQDELKAASVLRNHISREWQAGKGAGPTSPELTSFVRLVYVHILDVDPGGHAELDAKNTLRQRILMDPPQADAAWNTLITITGAYAIHHQRGHRPALQRALTDTGINLQAQRSYREDIERLKGHTTITLRTLLDFSRIHAGQHIVTIARGATTEVQNAATQDHLLILGVPGAGKSGSLYEVANTLITQGQDVVLFAVDQLEAASTGALRNELGLRHELTAILAAWPGTTPGYVMAGALLPPPPQRRQRNVEAFGRLLFGKILGLLLVHGHIPNNWIPTPFREIGGERHPCTKAQGQDRIYSIRSLQGAIQTYKGTLEDFFQFLLAADDDGYYVSIVQLCRHRANTAGRSPARLRAVNANGDRVQ